jgi:hemoglobin
LRRLFLYPIMKILNNIENFEDIKLLVDTFYFKVQKEDLIGPIFNEKTGSHGEPHLKKCIAFSKRFAREKRLLTKSFSSA